MVTVVFDIHFDPLFAIEGNEKQEIEAALRDYAALFAPQIDDTVFYDDELDCYFIGDDDFNRSTYHTVSYEPKLAPGYDNSKNQKWVAVWAVGDEERFVRFVVLGTSDDVYDAIGSYIEKFGIAGGGMTGNSVVRWYKYDGRTSMRHFFIGQRLQIWKKRHD